MTSKKIKKYQLKVKVKNNKNIIIIFKKKTHFLNKFKNNLIHHQILQIPKKIICLQISKVKFLLIKIINNTNNIKNKNKINNNYYKKVLQEISIFPSQVPIFLLKIKIKK